jgi:hypothetical protein
MTGVARASEAAAKKKIELRIAQRMNGTAVYAPFFLRDSVGPSKLKRF